MFQLREKAPEDRTGEHHAPEKSPNAAMAVQDGGDAAEQHQKTEGHSENVR
jgi:hypothetical protein